ncbi:BRO family protein [Enterobacter hormaechei subsp. steigerwaltii]|nr:BRO family protein [Enterobacter hormaechei]MDF7702142.1 BRO family protein [Enterobacter hormaechei subsp. steigerwaltii]
MLKHKSVEAPAALTVRASVSNKSSDGNIDMNIVAKSDLNFHGVSLTPVDSVSGVWLTSSDIAKALGYASSKSVSTIYSRNSDEFTSSMTMVIKMKTIGINNSLREKSVRVFSLRGCHLIAMFATTDKAKEFRRWVLDVLDREVANGSVSPAFNFEMHAHNAKVALDYAEFIYQHWCEEIRPSLSLVGSPLANSLNERIKVLASITYGLNSGLAKAAKEKGMIH